MSGKIVRRGPRKETRSCVGTLRGGYLKRGKRRREPLAVKSDSRGAKDHMYVRILDPAGKSTPRNEATLNGDGSREIIHWDRIKTKPQTVETEDRQALRGRNVCHSYTRREGTSERRQCTKSSVWEMGFGENRLQWQPGPKLREKSQNHEQHTENRQKEGGEKGLGN